MHFILILISFWQPLNFNGKTYEALKSSKIKADLGTVNYYEVLKFENDSVAITKRVEIITDDLNAKKLLEDLTNHRSASVYKYSINRKKRSKTGIIEIEGYERNYVFEGSEIIGLPIDEEHESLEFVEL